MTDTQRREAARQFYQKWVNKGKEDEDDRSYWIDLLQDVFGIDHVTDRIEFQKKVIGPDGNTKKIDAYIPETKVLIEQKSLGIALDKPQQGHNGMTPYEQAKMYDNSLPVSEKARWIVLSNFGEIWVYDMDTKKPEPKKFALAEMQTKYSAFEFLVNKEEKTINREMEISFKAGEFVGLIYDALLKQYKNPESEESLKSLNMLCVRLVFCLYAEDALLFGSNGHMFHDYLEKFDAIHMRKALIDLFKILDTPEDQRDPYEESDLAQFPYVNGGLFAEEDIEIPNFTDEIRNILLKDASEGFDWSEISPTIFGAVFESTLNPETRRSSGMHYTSIENIHKVIDPLFLDELKDEYERISEIQVNRTRKARLEAFQSKLASLKFLDPACGSGNFLTETYISLRRLENKVIWGILNCDRNQVDNQLLFVGVGSIDNPIKVAISQFYGIEINDFACTVAKTALWIAESQMLKETEKTIHMHLDFLPLKTNAHIIEGNALSLDWEEIVLSHELNYIIGNPPFVGARLMSEAQKKDILNVFGPKWKGVGNLDYVSCWYKKCTDYMKNTAIRAALVSTNSVSQGESVSVLWKNLFNRGISIDFAYQTFIWDSEASTKAHVHCVIIGFSYGDSVHKKLYVNAVPYEVANINAYLVNAENVFIDSRKHPVCNVPEMVFGNMANDGGYFIFDETEKDNFIKEEPMSDKYFRVFLGSAEFINNKLRYCLWLRNANPSEIKNMPKVMERINHVKEVRETSNREATKKLASTPSLFGEIRQPEDGNYLLVPRVSSERRRYVPMGFLSSDVIASDASLIIPNATLYHFGILVSNVHMAWMRTVAGRLKSDYRYSKDIVYNNFPWPTPTDEQKAKIEQTAQGILDARALYPGSSLADLYDPLTMPPELQKAHTANDRAVMQAYGFSIKDMSEADCVAELMKMYQRLTEKE